VDPSDVFPLPVSEGVVEMVNILFTQVIHGPCRATPKP
jgi:hypothetical protein